MRALLLAALLLGCSSPAATEAVANHADALVSSPTVSPAMTTRHITNVVTDGDSITFGYNVEPSHTYPAQLQSLLANVHVTNVAISGRQLVQLLPEAQAKVDALYDASERNVLVLLAGSNDLAFGKTLAETAERLWAYVDARHRVGWDVIVGTLTPRDEIPPVLRAQYNDAIREGAPLHSVVVADFARDPRIGYEGAQRDRVYFGDWVHPSAAGDVVLADIVRGVVAP